MYLRLSGPGLFSQKGEFIIFFCEKIAIQCTDTRDIYPNIELFDKMSYCTSKYCLSLSWLARAIYH